MPFIVRIDDIGRLPDDPPESGSDRNLEYFAKWRSAWHDGSAGKPMAPICYAAVPDWISESGLAWLRSTLEPQERLAVHGKHHGKGHVLSVDDWRQSLARLDRPGVPCNATVPPFNEYDIDTLGAFASHRPDGFFFGGITGEHHNWGEMPLRAKGCWHVPAFKPLYGRADQVMDAADCCKEYQCPLVLTLHVSWDQLGRLRPLSDLVSPYTVGMEWINDWERRSTPVLNDLKGAHYFAVRYVLDRIQIGDRLLDVGARHSKLGCYAALRGVESWCLDRCLDLVQEQQRNCAQLGVKNVNLIQADAKTANLADFGSFSVISALWAIQHNMDLAEQAAIYRKLADLLEPGGKLIVVSSYTPAETFEQTNREDPQLVLSMKDHKGLIAQSGLVEEELQTWSYTHGLTEFSAFCAADRANAIAYMLRKPE